nr:bifunctional inhibitor/plant lipid transfer protein/seed storage helical domain-containing protein [Tanacetum cinerariifolium]
MKDLSSLTTEAQLAYYHFLYSSINVFKHTVEKGLFNPVSTAAGPLPDRGAVLSPAAPGNDGSNGASSNAVYDLSTIICLVVAIFISYYF